MNNKKIGIKISIARKLTGLSQISLAEKLGVSRQTLSYWENGTAVPRIPQLEKIAAILCQDLNYFLGSEITTEDLSDRLNRLRECTNIQVKDSPYGIPTPKLPPVTAIEHAGVVLFTDQNAMPNGKMQTQFTVKAAEDTPYFDNGDSLIFDTQATPQNGSIVLIHDGKNYKITAYKKAIAEAVIATAIFKSL